MESGRGGKVGEKKEGERFGVERVRNKGREKGGKERRTEGLKSVREGRAE